MSTDSGVRINKYLADQGYCSRREAEELIRQGWVEVNGEVLTDLSRRITAKDYVVVHNKAKKHIAEKLTLVLNKPVGYVSAQAEDGHPPAIRLILKKNYAGAGKPPFIEFKGFAPAGRLDIDSKGLLILTQDGRLAKKVIGENSEIEKEYLVKVTGTITPAKLKKLCHGLSLDGKKLKPALVEMKSEYELRFILKEGRKRQIRRMCDLVELKVTSLKRIRIGRLKIGNLKEGQWRLLSRNEEL